MGYKKNSSDNEENDHDDGLKFAERPGLYAALRLPEFGHVRDLDSFAGGDGLDDGESGRRHSAAVVTLSEIGDQVLPAYGADQAVGQDAFQSVADGYLK